MTILKKSAFAKLQGWSPSYITKLAAQGRLVLDENKKVIVEASLLKIKATAGARDDVAARNAEVRTAKPRKKITANKKEAGELAKTIKPAKAVKELRAKNRVQHTADKLDFENQLQKLKINLAQGLRFENRAVREEATGIGNKLRSEIERLIDTTAPRLAIAKTMDERNRILQIELSAMRKAIKNAFPRALLRLAKQKNG